MHVRIYLRAILLNTFLASPERDCDKPCRPRKYIADIGRPQFPLQKVFSFITHIRLASFLWDMRKQCIPRSDATERGVSSGSPLFTYRKFYSKLNKNEKNTIQQPLKWKSTGPIDKSGKFQ